MRVDAAEKQARRLDIYLDLHNTGSTQELEKVKAGSKQLQLVTLTL